MAATALVDGSSPNGLKTVNTKDDDEDQCQCSPFVICERAKTNFSNASSVIHDNVCVNVY